MIKPASQKSPKIYFVLGEESGDALAADLYDALIAQLENGCTVVGLAGEKLEDKGVKSLFDINDIAVMGFSAVIARLPTIIKRVRATVTDIVRQQPDIIVLIDSPDFTHAVAKRVRKQLPNVPIVNYVCPSVWAWRSGRAAKMTAYVDHVLAILPFEPAALKRLNGPPATYIGHPLSTKFAAQSASEKNLSDIPEVPKLLVLPGSRQSELNRMLDPYHQTLQELRRRGVAFDVIIPAVPKLRNQIEQQTSHWSPRPIIVSSADNERVFSEATAALATSGTVSLELALHRVPMVVCYILDPIAKLFGGLIKTWSVVLPNLIVDRVLVPEEINNMVDPQRLARRLERLLADTPERQIQLDGFDDLAGAMKTKKPPSEMAASVIINHLV